jgi:stage II sporulation protein AA (anti-sigma F factor antagonist)
LVAHFFYFCRRAGKGKTRVEMSVHQKEGVNRLSLHIELKQQRNVLIVRLKGELDHHTAETVKTRMEEVLAKGKTNHVVLSLKHLSFMDSSGLGVILGRYKQVVAKGGKMVVCEPNPAVYRLFEMSGLFKILSIQDNESTALSSLEVVS